MPASQGRKQGTSISSPSQTRMEPLLSGKVELSLGASKPVQEVKPRLGVCGRASSTNSLPGRIDLGLRTLARASPNSRTRQPLPEANPCLCSTDSEANLEPLPSSQTAETQVECRTWEPALSTSPTCEAVDSSSLSNSPITQSGSVLNQGTGTPTRGATGTSCTD